MKIGILSDTHNHKENTLAELEVFKGEGVAQLLHCGDITDPNMIPLFAGWPITFVTGNMDRDTAALAAAARSIGASPPQQMVSLTLEGVPIVMMHGHLDEALQDLIERQKHRLVLHGHTHRRRNDLIGRTRVLNPGALGGTRHQSRSVAVVDLASGDARFFELD